MSIHKLNESIKQQALLALSSRAFPTLGQISGYDSEKYLVTVQIYAASGDEPSIITAPIPLLSPWVGNGWGMFCPPSPGDICMVFFQEGDYQSPMAALRLFNDINQPLNVPSGEFWLIHKSGSTFKFTNDGKVNISSSTNSGAEIDLSTPTMNITVTGSCKLDCPDVQLGNVSGTLHKLITDQLIAAFNSHIHPDPASGFTGTPTVLLDNTVLTENVRAT